MILAPRNITTAPAKKGMSTNPDITLSDYPEHFPDNYDSVRESMQRERAYHLSKLQEAPFKSVNVFGNPFFTDREQYGVGDRPQPPKSARKLREPKIVEHDRAFTPTHPAKKGIVDKTIGKFPEYISEPP